MTAAPGGGLPLSRELQGALFMLFSAAMLSVGNVMIRHVTRDVPGIEVVFFRSVFALVWLAPILFHQGLGKVLRTDRIKLHAIRVTLMTVAMICYFTGLGMTPLVDVAALEFLGPIVATVLAIVVLGERVRLRRTIALIVGFAGALIALRPGIAEVHLGQAFILASVFAWSVMLLAVKRLSSTESSLTQNLYVILFQIPVVGLLCIPFWVTPDWPSLAIMFAIGLTATIGQLAYVQAFRMAEMTALLPLDFTKLGWAALLGWLVFAEIPDPWAVAGGTIIFAAAFYITWRDARSVSRF